MALNLAALSLKTKLIAGATAVVVVGGGVAGYATYQSPDTVIGQAFGSLAESANPSYIIDASLNSASVSGTATIEIDTAKTGNLVSLGFKAKYAGSNLGATLNALSVTSGDAYVGLSDFDSLAKFVVENQLLSSYAVDNLTVALKDTWVKVPKETLKALAGQRSCLTDKLNDVSYTTKAGKEFSNFARANFFLVSKKELAQSGSDRVFVLGIDANKLKGFMTAFTKTSIYTDIQSCSNGWAITSADIAKINQKDIDASMKNYTVTLYADSASHKLSKLVFDAKSDGQSVQFSLKNNGDQSAKVKVPTKTITAEQLMAALMMAGSN